tara:strand:+ start:1611 stop:1925 length:315 start_codon:yes stop_codon:yes gene_type:complete
MIITTISGTPHEFNNLTEFLALPLIVAWSTRLDTFKGFSIIQVDANTVSLVAEVNKEIGSVVVGNITPVSEAMLLGLPEYLPVEYIPPVHDLTGEESTVTKTPE